MKTLILIFVLLILVLRKFEVIGEEELSYLLKVLI